MDGGATVFTGNEFTESESIGQGRFHTVRLNADMLQERIEKVLFLDIATVVVDEAMVCKRIQHWAWATRVARMRSPI